MITEPWKISITGSSKSSIVAEITRTSLKYKQVGDAWEGYAKLKGHFLEHGDLSYEEALVVTLIFLINREDDAELDYWYVDQDFLIVRVEPQKALRVLSDDGKFNLDITVKLTAMSCPDGMSEREVIEASMDYIFSDLDGEITDEALDEGLFEDEEG